MTQFIYKALNQNEQIVTETINSASREEVAKILKDQGLKILSIKEKTVSQLLKTGSGKLNTVEKANLCRYLATMIDAGLPLTEAVETIAQDSNNQALKNLLNEVKRRLQQGEALSDIFTSFPKLFDEVFITIIKAGEKSGKLHQALRYLYQQLMASYSLSQKVKGALLYPAVIIGTMLAVGVILIVFVIPQISSVFLKSKLPVPKFTRMILETGLAINHNLVLIGAILGGLLISLIMLLRTYQGKKRLMLFLRQLPLVRNMFEKLDWARFSRTLSTLMASGVPIIDSLNVATTALTQKKFKGLVKTLKEDVRQGVSLASIFRQHQEAAPQILVSMIATGEKTGTIDKVLVEVADFYEQELENEVKNFTAILEPIIMLIIGAGVGGMVLSVIAPIYSLVSNLQAGQ